MVAKRQYSIAKGRKHQFPRTMQNPVYIPCRGVRQLLRAIFLREFTAILAANIPC